MIRRRSLVTLAAALTLVSAGCAQQLRSSSGQAVGLPVDINDTDAVLSVSYTGGIPHGLVLSGPGGAVTVINGPGGAGFTPNAVNDAGTVVGAMITGAGRTQSSRAVRWTRAGGFEQLPLPAGTFQSWATDVNNRGQIVVNAYSPSGSPGDGAYVWMPTAGLARLTDPAGAPNGRASVAEAINEAGVAVGASGNGAPAGSERAVRWDATSRAPVVLSTPAVTSRALDVNEVGTIVGTAVPGAVGEPGHAAAWLAPAHVHVDLGVGEANAVNDSNLAVGQAGTPAQAAMWSVITRVMVPLGELMAGGGSNATGVNNLGRAVGDANGDSVHYPIAQP